MTDAFIYDPVRTPRGKGKADGSLHEVTALNLATQALGAIKEPQQARSACWSTTWCSAASIRSARPAATSRARRRSSPATATRSPGVQINRFCASGLDAVNFAAAQVMSGQHDMTIGGGVEFDEPRRHRAPRAAPGRSTRRSRSPTYFMPQGISADLIATKYGFSRDDVDAYAVESQKRSTASWDDGHFRNSVMPVKDVNGLTILAKDEHMRPTTTMQSLGAAAAVVRADGRDGRLRRGRDAGASGSRVRRARASRRQFVRASSTARPRC